MKNLFILLLLLSSMQSAIIGLIEKGRIDKSENAFALVTRGDEVIPVSKLGFKVKRSDSIKTFRKSTIQIRLKDNTIIKIGKRSTLRIEKYLYNSKNTKNNAANFKIENGTFQIKTGKIADTAPKTLKLRQNFLL